MKTHNNTILITGGGSGIGFEIAKLCAANNKVIITGRDEQRLKTAVAGLDNASYIVCDVTKEEDVTTLAQTIENKYPHLNLLINNAGKVSVYNLIEKEINAFEKAQEEMLTNYLSVVRLTEKLLPILTTNSESAIVNVTSVAAVVPSQKLITYSASKAALHFYTVSLRRLLQDTSVKVFEVMPPLVNTEFSKEVGGENGISPELVATELLKGLQENQFEIPVGATVIAYEAYLVAALETLEASKNN
ncbi:SDR family oxidoreductase [Flavobacterium sp.]|uniref:SDR family oxidoreductase n=1 Tax=Flavobacterium sp. TaxID=239 RepID=UPI003D6B8990